MSDEYAEITRKLADYLDSLRVRLAPERFALVEKILRGVVPVLCGKQPAEVVDTTEHEDALLADEADDVIEAVLTAIALTRMTGEWRPVNLGENGWVLVKAHVAEDPERVADIRASIAKRAEEIDMDHLVAEEIARVSGMGPSPHS
ncbi:MAG: hypothetical protein WCD21_40640 [Streptomyces sp.]